jgi:hypothetical protein
MSIASDDYGDPGDSRTEALFAGVPASDYTEDPYFFTGDPDLDETEVEPVGEFEADVDALEQWVGISGLPDN